MEFPRFCGQLRTSKFRAFVGAPFEVDGRTIAEGGVPPPGIVPALEELKDGHAGLRLVLELALLEQFAFQGREVALAHPTNSQKIDVGSKLKF